MTTPSTPAALASVADVLDRMMGAEKDRLASEYWAGEILTALRSLSPASSEGWRLVPVEPTIEMTRAAMEWLDTPFYSDIEIAYRAMIAAAPPIPGDAS